MMWIGLEPAEAIKNAIKDSVKRLDGPDKKNLGEDELLVRSWPQVWTNTSCGFGGMAGQAISSAQTVVVEGPSGAVCVYHGRFAYLVQKPNRKFWDDVSSQKLLGASGAWRSRYEDRR